MDATFRKHLAARWALMAIEGALSEAIGTIDSETNGEDDGHGRRVASEWAARPNGEWEYRDRLREMMHDIQAMLEEVREMREEIQEREGE